MKKVVASLVVIGCLCSLATAAQAQEKIKIGVLDARKVMIDSKPGQQHRLEREKMIKERQEKLQKEEAQVKSLGETFEKNRLTFTDQQKVQKQKELEEKMTALQKLAAEAQQEVGKRDKEYSDKAGAAILAIIADIAKQDQLAMVIDKNQPGVFWIDSPVDITERVGKAFEARGGK